MQPALFLDRDGVIIEEAEYLSDPEVLRLIPGAAAALARVNQQDIPVIVVSNQSGVARGFFPLEQVDLVHRRLDDALAEFGARIDRYYYCPHHPSEGQWPYRIQCRCRKPQPGMLFQAARELDLDLRRSLMIGDKLSDLEAGSRAGCETVLVRTGYGKLLGDVAHDARPVFVAKDLGEAVAFCLSRWSSGFSRSSA